MKLCLRVVWEIGVRAHFFVMILVQKSLNGDTDARIWKVMQATDSSLGFY